MQPSRDEGLDSKFYAHSFRQGVLYVFKYTLMDGEASILSRNCER